MARPSHDPASARPRGRYAKTDATRQLILDAALQVFAHSGYRAGSVRTIATMVGMTEAGISYHFPSKAALLEAVLERRNRESLAIVGTGDDGLATINGIVRLLRGLPEVRGLAELYCVVSAESIDPDHPAHEHFVHQREESRRVVRAAFRDLEERGKLAPGLTPDIAAQICSAHFDGVQLQWLLAPEDIDMVGQLEALLRQLIPGWEPEGTVDVRVPGDGEGPA